MAHQRQCYHPADPTRDCTDDLRISTTGISTSFPVWCRSGQTVGASVRAETGLRYHVTPPAAGDRLELFRKSWELRA